MQNIYPLFERNRILKKELLWSLRDYSFAYGQLQYQEYGQGILRGCAVRVDGNRITVGPGILKYGSFICLMTEEESVEYVPSEQTVALKLQFQKTGTADYILYQMYPVLDVSWELAENEIEVCRYKLQEGAELRSDYRSFEDMGTEYDTLNHISATWGGLHGKAMAPAVTRRFAEEILKAGGGGPEDTAFAYLCLGQPEALPWEILVDYTGKKIQRRLERDIPNPELFGEMCRALAVVRDAVEERRVQRMGRRKIIVD